MGSWLTELPGGLIFGDGGGDSLEILSIGVFVCPSLEASGSCDLLGGVDHIATVWVGLARLARGAPAAACVLDVGR